METFNQTASSCVGCHSFARSTNPFNLADFSWFVCRAKFPPGEVPGREFLKLKPSPEEVLEIVYGKRPNAFTGRTERPYEDWGTWPKDAWKGNADFMLTFNFGKPPVIRTRCVDDAGKGKDCEEGAFNENR